jgi:hypothetical protein
LVADLLLSRKPNPTFVATVINCNIFSQNFKIRSSHNYYSFGMNKSIFLSGIVISAIVAIAPAVSAQSIRSGWYTNQHPDNMTVVIKTNRYSVVYSDNTPVEPWKAIPKGVFTPIKPGVFYSNINKEYYCLVNSNLEKERNKKGSRVAGFSCSKNGWKTIYK